MSDKLRVWAPLLEEIQIEVATGEGSSRSPMEPADGGWWEALSPPSGAPYRFVFDDMALPTLARSASRKARTGGRRCSITTTSPGPMTGGPASHLLLR